MTLDVRATAARPAPGRRYDCTTLDPGTLSMAWELDHASNTIAAGHVLNVVNRLDPGTGDLAQVAPVNASHYEATGWGGTRPSMLFTAADTQWMYCNAAAPYASGEDKAFTIILAQEVTAILNARLWCFGNSADNDPKHEVYTDAAGQLWTLREDDATATKNPAPTLTTSGRQIYAYSCAGTTVSTYVNGVPDIVAGDIDVGVATLDRFSIGCRGLIGESNYATVRCGAIWVFSSALTSAQVQVNTRAMAARWPIN